MGVNPLKAPMEVYIANFPWGKYVPGNDGADVCISSWNRLAPNTMPSLAKAGANYMNSQLIRMEAEINGYSEGIALDVNGYLSEGSGENLFVVRGGTLYTTPLANSVLNGITRASVLTIAKSLGIPVVEQALPHRREVCGSRRGVFFRRPRRPGLGERALESGDAVTPERVVDRPHADLTPPARRSRRRWRPRPASRCARCGRCSGSTSRR